MKMREAIISSVNSTSFGSIRHCCAISCSRYPAANSRAHSIVSIDHSRMCRERMSARRLAGVSGRSLHSMPAIPRAALIYCPQMKEIPLTAEECLALLRENARRLVSLTDGLPSERLHTAPDPHEWSPNDVLAHIRACCDVWGGNIAKILAHDHPTFAGMNPRTWMNRTDYPEWPFDKALAAFSAQRKELLGTVDGLTPADWERTAFVTSYGTVGFDRTVRSYASQLAKHERTHVRQIERALA
jgi:hypothetical protein